MFINPIAFHVHYVYQFHQYFAGDIAFRFLQYIQSQTDDSIMSEENFSIPSGIGAGAYSIPSEYAEEEKIDLSDYKEDTSHVTVILTKKYWMLGNLEERRLELFQVTRRERYSVPVHVQNVHSFNL